MSDEIRKLFYKMIRLHMLRENLVGSDCWCGSGELYEHCHRSRHAVKPLKPGAFSRRFRGAYKVKECFHYNKSECSNQIIKAHTISNSNSLSRLANAEGVLLIIPDSINVFFDPRNGGRINFVNMNKKKATIFHGFCSHHDSIYSPIDNLDDFNDIDQELLALFMYRQICREVFAKKRAIASMKDALNYIDNGRNPMQQLQIQQESLRMIISNEIGLQDIEKVKSECELMFMADDFSRMRSVCFKLSNTPNFMVSSSFFATYSCDGEELYDLSDLSTSPNAINFSISSVGNEAVVIFSYLGEDDNCEKFINSLRAHSANHTTLKSIISTTAFEFCENIVANKEWWENLSDDEKNLIRNRMDSALDVGNERNERCLIDNRLPDLVGADIIGEINF